MARGYARTVQGRKIDMRAYAGDAMLDHLAHDHPLRPALRAFNLQQHAQARALLAGFVATQGETDDAVELAGRMDALERPRPAGPPALVWQYDNAARWEGEWLRWLTDGLVGEEIEDRRAYATIRPRMVVVENELNGRSADYLRRAFRSGADIVLLHLGDEAYLQDLAPYRWCRAVFRNYRDRTLAGRRDVQVLPLGCKAGFARPEVPRPAAVRSLAWGFAGDLNKTTRIAMLTAMAQVQPYRLHQTAGWDTADALPVGAYRALMDDSVFVPCPTGFASLDSFRVFEALEAGCIPIVERRDGEEYFAAAYGPHPMPVVRDWAEAPGLIRRMNEAGRVEAVRRACHGWWQALKHDTRARLAAALA